YTSSSNSCNGRLNWSSVACGGRRGQRAPSALGVWTMHSARAFTQANRATLRCAATCRLRDAWPRTACVGEAWVCLCRGGKWMSSSKTEQTELRRVQACSSTLLVGACARAVK
ncbi:hypothetical protein COCMIDRAFT_96747, partial [Bipolaris oryzae ATCC 44560]